MGQGRRGQGFILKQRFIFSHFGMHEVLGTPWRKDFLCSLIFQSR